MEEELYDGERGAGGAGEGKGCFTDGVFGGVCFGGYSFTEVLYDVRGDFEGAGYV